MSSQPEEASLDLKNYGDIKLFWGSLDTKYTNFYVSPDTSECFENLSGTIRLRLPHPLNRGGYTNTDFICRLLACADFEYCSGPITRRKYVLNANSTQKCGGISIEYRFAEFRCFHTIHMFIDQSFIEQVPEIQQIQQILDFDDDDISKKNKKKK